MTDQRIIWCQLFFTGARSKSAPIPAAYSSFPMPTRIPETRTEKEFIWCEQNCAKIPVASSRRTMECGIERCCRLRCWCFSHPFLIFVTYITYMRYVEKNLSCGEILDLYAWQMWRYLKFLRMCSKIAYVEKKWKIPGMLTPHLLGLLWLHPPPEFYLQLASSI